MVPTVVPSRSTIASARQRSSVAGSKAAMVVLLALAIRAAPATPPLTARRADRLTGQRRSRRIAARRSVGGRLLQLQAAGLGQAGEQHTGQDDGRADQHGGGREAVQGVG